MKFIITNVNCLYFIVDIFFLNKLPLLSVWAWKLSRAKLLSDNGKTQIDTAIANNPTVTLRNDYFEPVDQSDDACFYFPDLEPGAPVILPGLCDTADNIPYIRDFNLTAVRSMVI